MNFLVICNPQLASVSTLHVLFGGNHDSKCSRYTEREEGKRPPMKVSSSRSRSSGEGKDLARAFDWLRIAEQDHPHRNTPEVEPLIRIGHRILLIRAAHAIQQRQVVFHRRMSRRQQRFAPLL